MSKNDITVLLVEDELTLAMIIKDTLEENGFTIHTASDGEEGLHLFFELRPDVLVADVMCAAISGDSSMFPSLRTMMKLASLSAFITLLYVTSPIPLKRLRLCHPFWVAYCRRSRTVLNPISPYKTL